MTTVSGSINKSFLNIIKMQSRNKTIKDPKISEADCKNKKGKVQRGCGVFQLRVLFAQR